jgi:hypothetical protein
MTRQLGVAMALVLAAATATMAGTDGPRRAGREDAPRLMKEAVRAGTADAAAFAAIADWILHEKEEKVAAGLIDVLGAVEPEVARASGARWNDTTRAMFSLFAGVLRDAHGNRRRSGQELDAEIAALVKVATPAVASALGDDLAPLLGAEVTTAAREALEKIKDR